MDRKLNALEQINACLGNGKNFLLQGGAGSGKTEALKEVLGAISTNYPGKNVACITLTNKAADEIKSRVKSKFHVSTIHSFLHGLISRYPRNIQSVLGEIFHVKGLTFDEGKESAVEHALYKSAYEKYATTLYRFSKVKSAKVIGKPDYDKNPSPHVTEIVELTSKLNSEIDQFITAADCYSITYNESPFDNIGTLSYGHDGLLRISALLLEKYTTFQKILSDRYNYIFVDEYQDTSPDIVEVLLDVVAKNCDVVIGLFGDSMQGIYKDGVGDVEKEDNFRCSLQVVGFLNTLRLDTLQQEVALKADLGGRVESIDDRQGEVSCYYCVVPEGSRENRDLYVSKLNSLISKANPRRDAKILMLTNKSIAKEVGFHDLFDAFNERYGQDSNEQMKRISTLLQFDELNELCNLFKNSEFNDVIVRAKKAGFVLASQEDKVRLYDALHGILNSTKPSISTLQKAFDARLLRQSDACIGYMERKDAFLKEAAENQALLDFIEDVANGRRTALQMRAGGRIMDDYLHKDLKRLSQKKAFYGTIFSDDISYQQMQNYMAYMNDEKAYVTMHKTKGTGIKNVVVVLDEYFWNAYDFKNVLAPMDTYSNQAMDRKLVYVAASRAIQNLTCVRFVSQDEEDQLRKTRFDRFEKIEFESL
jgi:DNA helicase-2/ATP-dependent DNA helicase PcrA